MKILALSLSVIVCGCGFFESPEPRPLDVSRTEPSDGEESPTMVFDEATRQAALAKRFPGADRIDLVRVLVWSGDRAGACWTEAARPWEIAIDARYRADGSGDRHAKSLKELKEQGWLALYRAPNGTGFERRQRFESLDLTVETDYACRCSVGARGAIEEDRVPLRLRVRWEGKGRMPEVSASTMRDGRREGLRGAFSFGNLLSYEFPVRAPFPAGRPGLCGGSLAVWLLSDPPML